MEERILMKWFQNPFSNHSRWQLKRAWWQLVAPGLIKENREWAQMVDRRWDDLEKRGRRN
jgi:hypothetical protein